MIEIKNKRMLLYPEDRLIGAAGDIETAERKFVLDKVQGGFDLSGFVAYIKLEPKSGEEPYDQLLSKKVEGDKIILTWQLVGANLKSAGEISAQIVLASPDFFNADDLSNLSDGDLVVPATIEGVSAPVWQSFKETFVVDESIDATAAYQEVSKNVLTSAIAEAAQSVDDCQRIRDNVADIYGDIMRDLEASEGFASTASNYALQTRDDSAAAAASALAASESAVQAEASAAQAKQSEDLTNEYQEMAYAYEQSALYYCQKSDELYFEIKNFADNFAKAECYRPIFTKTLTEEDTGIVSFEVTQDMQENALNLSAFAVYMYVPQMETAQSVYLRLDIKAADDDGYSRISQFAGLSKSADVYFRLEAENRGRWNAKFSKSNAWFQNAESVNVYNTICANSRSTDGKAVSAIKLSQASAVNADFPVGTYIEMWGVDAPAGEVV